MDGRKDLRELVQGFRRAIRFLMAPIVVLSLAGCADLRGIQAFGKMAPDAATIQGLTKIYVQEPGVREDIKLLGDSAPNPELEQNGPIRAQEAHAIQAIDGSLRAYMQSLAALAGDDIVQSSSSVKGVTTGLTSLSKSIPALGITGDQITAIGHFIQSVADLIESGYRNAELVKIIRDNDKELHLLLSVQSTIVSRGINPSILEIQRSLNESAAAAAIKYIDQDLGHWTVTPGVNAPAGGTAARQSCSTTVIRPIRGKARRTRMLRAISLRFRSRRSRPRSRRNWPLRMPTSRPWMRSAARTRSSSPMARMYSRSRWCSRFSRWRMRCIRIFRTSRHRLRSLPSTEALPPRVR